MEKKQIENIIDQKIEKLYKDGCPSLSIIEQLEVSRNKMLDFLKRNGISLDNVDLDSEKNSNKIKYYALYINHCEGRMVDVEWIGTNKNRFPFYESSKIFRMLKLRDKLSGK